MKLKKTIIAKGAVQRTVKIVEHKTEEMQSGAMYIFVFVKFYNRTFTCIPSSKNPPYLVAF